MCVRHLLQAEIMALEINLLGICLNMYRVINEVAQMCEIQVLTVWHLSVDAPLKELKG